MQEYLDVDSPVSGAMLCHSMWHGQHRFAISPPRVLGVECEIVVRLGRDLLAREQPYSTYRVADAVFDDVREMLQRQG